MNHEDVRALLSDYVLGLLSPKDKSEIEGHLASCTSCRLIAQEERLIGLLVADTLNATIRTDAVRLRRLMPSAAPARRTAVSLPRWAAQLAPVTAVLLLLLFSFLLRAPQEPRPLPAILYTTSTATMTHTPTATLSFGSATTTLAAPHSGLDTIGSIMNHVLIATPSAPLVPAAPPLSIRSK